MEGVTVEISSWDDGVEHGRSTWRICFEDDDGNEWVLDQEFGRQQDAEMALEALARAGYTRDDLLEQPTGGPLVRNDLDRIIAEALQW